jgi:hypothetical protein
LRAARPMAATEHSASRTRPAQADTLIAAPPRLR